MINGTDIEKQLVSTLNLIRKAKLQLIETLLEVGCPHGCGDKGCPYYRRLQAIKEGYASDNSLR